MIKNYIIAELSKKKEFRFDISSFTVLGIHLAIADVKFDTGCGYSTIPLQRFVTQTYALREKEKDVDQLISKLQGHISNGYSLEQAKKLEYKRSYTLSYGVETDGYKHEPINFLSKNDLMQEKAINFRHKVTQFTVHNSMCEVEMPDTYMLINYNRKGNILLGMDIIENWDVHLSKSITSNKNTLLACAIDQMNDDYLQALTEEFHIGLKR